MLLSCFFLSLSRVCARVSVCLCVCVFECSFLMNCVPHSIKFLLVRLFFFLRLVCSIAAVEGATECKIHNAIFSNAEEMKEKTTNAAIIIICVTMLFLCRNACCSRIK